MENLAWAAVSFLTFAVVVFTAARFGREWLFGLSFVFIVISNTTIQMIVEIVPGIQISWAIIIYSMVYLITDLVIEFYGKEVAYRLAVGNLAVQIVVWMYAAISLRAHPFASGQSIAISRAVGVMFGSTARISVAAIVAAIGPFTDIFVTHRIREFVQSRMSGRDGILGLILRAKLSTFVGELINTVAFFGIAIGTVGMGSRALLSVVAAATITKWSISAADAPLMWIFYKTVGPPSDCVADTSSTRHAVVVPTAGYLP